MSDEEFTIQWLKILLGIVTTISILFLLYHIHMDLKEVIKNLKIINLK